MESRQTLLPLSQRVYWDEQKAGNFDVCFDGWTGDYLDPDTNLNCFTQARAYNQNRWSGENAMKYDSMIEECRNLADNSKRMEIFKEAEAILMDEMPIIPLYYLNAIVLAKAGCDRSGEERRWPYPVQKCDKL